MVVLICNKGRVADSSKVYKPIIKPQKLYDDDKEKMEAEVSGFRKDFGNCIGNRKGMSSVLDSTYLKLIEYCTLKLRDLDRRCCRPT